jgi:hypothetical protein
VELIDEPRHEGLFTPVVTGEDQKILVVVAREIAGEFRMLSTHDVSDSVDRDESVPDECGIEEVVG